MATRVLIVDDDPVQRRLLEAAVTRFGYSASVADCGAAGLAQLEAAGAEAPIAAVVLDLVMPGLDGIGVLGAMRERGIEAPVIVQTAQGGIETVVNAMRNGAFDFVVKPVSPDRLKLALSNALKVEARGHVVRQSVAKAKSASFADLLSASPAMERTVRLARKAAASSIPVLIEGESGVGKEMVARAIQASGQRRGKAFVTVNCGAIPANLVESILFGHEKGSFTGATEKHAGKFVEANGGTLFLDEIGDLPLEVQVKLLRAVQEGEVDPVGGRGAVKVDVRLISATHRDLLAKVKEGTFREDLFYRLNVYPIAVPPLRSRRSDIEPLASHFIRRFSASETGGRIKGIAPRALALLKAGDWPGNIRQLENAIFRATVLCDGDMLEEQDFPQIRALVEGMVDLGADPLPVEQEVYAASSSLWSPPPSPVMAAPEAPVADLAGTMRFLDAGGDIRSLAEIEGEMIRLAIAHYGGQMSEVARRLGIGRSTLYRKLKDHGLEQGPVEFDEAAA